VSKVLVLTDMQFNILKGLLGQFDADEAEVVLKGLGHPTTYAEEMRAFQVAVKTTMGEPEWRNNAWIVPEDAKDAHKAVSRFAVWYRTAEGEAYWVEVTRRLALYAEMKPLPDRYGPGSSESAG
jgi:hypothetical protein